MDFEWKTEEEGRWDGASQAAVEASQGRSKPRWRLLLSILLLVASTSLVAYRMARLRIDKGTAAAEADLMAAYGVIQGAAARGDNELFLSLLGPNLRLQYSQREALQPSVLFDRSSLDLSLQEGAVAGAERQIVLAPDLQSATVSMTIPYTSYMEKGEIEAIHLQQPMFFQKRDKQWQLIALGVEDWGQWIQDKDENSRLQATYSERDALIASRLTSDIRAQLEDICATLGGCPNTMHPQLRFERDPAFLVSPSHWLSTSNNQFTIALASPSLVGYPQDEADYLALRRVYTRLFVTQLLRLYLTKPGLPDHSALVQAFRQRAFVELDLDVWPPPLSGTADPRRLGQDIALLCTNRLYDGASVVKFNHEERQWHSVFNGNFVEMRSLAGGEMILIQEQNLRSQDPNPGIWLWHGDRRRPVNLPDLFLRYIDDHDSIFYVYEHQQDYAAIRLHDVDKCESESCPMTRIESAEAKWSPNGSRLLLRTELEESGSLPAGEVALFLADADGANLRMLGPGTDPFWLDNMTFGYLRMEFVEQQHHNNELVLAGVNTLEPQMIVTSEQLQEALKDASMDDVESDETYLYLRHVAVHPAHPQTIFIIAVQFLPPADTATHSTQESNVLLFSVDRRSASVQHHFSLEFTMKDYYRPAFSPDGEWLTFTGYDRATMKGAFNLYNLEANELTTHVPFTNSYPTAIPSYDWLPDGRLLVLDEGVLHLLDPVTGDEEIIVPPVPGCANVAWLNS